MWLNFCLAILIKEFVKEVNRVPFKRRSTTSIPQSKKRATTCVQLLDKQLEEEQPIIQVDKIAAYLRQEITAWQRTQKEKLRNLKEYNVHVKLLKSDTTCSIECKKCNSLQTLGISVMKRAIISNWSRHITKCIKRPLPVQQCIHTLILLETKR